MRTRSLIVVLATALSLVAAGSGFFTGSAASRYPGQPVQGFSGVHALGDGSLTGDE